jgi:hypothetical protein
VAKLDITVIASGRLKKILREKAFKAIKESLEDADFAIFDKIQDEAIMAIRQTEEFQAIAGGRAGEFFDDLQAVLGIEDPDIALAEMLEVIKDGIDSELFLEDRKPVFVLKLLGGDTFNRLMAMSGGTYTSEPSGEEIPWLQWMLTLQSDPIAANLLIGESSDPAFKDSRTGRAIMTDIGTGKWDIQLHTNRRTNFIVRALSEQSFKTRVREIVQKEFLSQLQSRSA